MDSDKLNTVETKVSESLGKEVIGSSNIANPDANNTASSATCSAVKVHSTVTNSDKELSSKAAQSSSDTTCEEKQDERVTDTTTTEHDSNADVFQQLKTGQLSFDKIPKLPKNVVRIFLSSTFTGKIG